MWFHLTTVRLYLPNDDTVKETLHSDEFKGFVTEYGGKASYVLECPENSAEFNFLTLWDREEDAEAFFEGEEFLQFSDEIRPHLIAPLCQRRYEVMVEEPMLV